MFTTVMTGRTRRYKILLLTAAVLQCTVIIVALWTIIAQRFAYETVAEPTAKRQRERLPREIFASHYPVTVNCNETANDETSTKKSSWSVLSLNNSVGRPLHILLTTRAKNGKRRLTGGDFFNAVLTTQKPVLTSTHGEVKDFCNGSYLVTFVPPSSGQAKVSIKLWLTSRLVKMVRTKKTIDYTYWCVFGNNTYGYDNMRYADGGDRTALLPKMRSQHAILRECNMDWRPDLLPRSNTSCDMGFQQKYHWYGVCEGPRARHSTKCDDLKWCLRHEKVFEQGVKDRKLVKEMNSLVQGDVQSVMISGVREKDSFTRVPCQPQPLIRAKGYWLGREWVNRDCSLGSTSQKKWWQCLTNRSLHFIGDSTVKQLHYSILQSAGIIKQVVLRRPITSELRDVYRKQYNASIHFIQHGLPWCAHFGMNLTDAKFTIDHLDAVPANGNEIVVLSTVHHFTLMTPEGFRLRLQDIIDAIRRLRDRRQGWRIPIVFRTANPRDFVSLSINAYKVKWLNEIAVEMLMASKLDVIIYDIFDMLASSQNSEHVHPNDDIVAVEVSHILNLVCPDERHN